MKLDISMCIMRMLTEAIPQGIGRSCALLFAKEGAKVVVTEYVVTSDEFDKT